MKKLLFFMFFLILAVSAFGQQILWSTLRDTDERYVPLNNVTREVLTFYDQYDYYFDFSGFDKNTFIENFSNNSSDWDWIYEIEEMTILAMRINLGIEIGSAVYVMCIYRDRINMVVFVNASDVGSIRTFRHNRERFENWFRTLLN